MQNRRRDPADVARFTASAVALAAVVIVVIVRPASLHNLSVEVIGLAAVLPDTLQAAIVGTTQILALATAIGIGIAALSWRRWSVIVPAAIAAVTAAGLAALSADWVARSLPSTALRLPRPTWLIGESFPSAAYLAAVVAAVVTLSPSWSRQWRRAAWIGVVLVTLSRVLTAATVPIGIISAILLGTTVGSAMLLIFGIPRLRPRPDEIAAALEGLGISVTGVVTPIDPSKSQLRYMAEVAPRSRASDHTDDTKDRQRADSDHLDQLEVLLIDSNDRDADLFARFVRALRVRGDSDDQVGLSPDRIAEHTALVTLLAQTRGVPVDHVVALGALDSGVQLIVLDTPDGDPLSTFSQDEMTGAVLRESWRSLRQLHANRIAHRRAVRDNVVITSDGEAVWTGLRHGVIAANDHQLALDTAEFLISTALVVGPDRAVDAAVAEFPREDLISALPLIQPVILTSETRHEMGRKKDLVEQTRETLQTRTNAEPFELMPVQRITPMRLAVVVIGTFLTYAALSFASTLSEVSEALGQFSVAYLPLLIFFAALAYPLLALSTMGAAPIAIPFAQTTVVSLAQSLLNKFTPANAGGMALRVRYMQRLGMGPEQAATTLALTSAFSGVAQVIVLVIFGIWAGSSGDLSFSLPTSLIAPAIVVITTAGGLLYLTPWGRRIWSAKLLPPLTRAWPVVSELFRSPNRLALLVGANVTDKLVTVAAFVVSANAVGVHSSFAQLGFLYMTANTVAGAAPTPGGIGAMEAALTAALTSTGVPTAEALSVALVFRLATFWVPIPFGAVALSRVRKKGLV